MVSSQIHPNQQRWLPKVNHNQLPGRGRSRASDLASAAVAPECPTLLQVLGVHPQLGSRPGAWQEWVEGYQRGCYSV